MLYASSEASSGHFVLYISLFGCCCSLAISTLHIEAFPHQSLNAIDSVRLSCSTMFGMQSFALVILFVIAAAAAAATCPKLKRVHAKVQVSNPKKPQNQFIDGIDNQRCTCSPLKPLPAHIHAIYL